MKNLVRILAVVLITISFAFTDIDKKVVVIDVAHGGKDEGKTLKGTSEKEIVFQVAQKIKELNTNPNLEIVLTRETDEFLSLQDRKKYINALNPDAVISLHANFSLKKKHNGTEIFTSPNALKLNESEKLAEKILNNFDFREVRIKKTNFFLLKSVDAPIVCVELGFLSNTEDFNFLTSEGGQNQLARSILKSVE